MKTKRFLAGAAAIAVALSSMSFTAFAEEDDDAAIDNGVVSEDDGDFSEDDGDIEELGEEEEDDGLEEAEEEVEGEEEQLVDAEADTESAKTGNTESAAAANTFRVEIPDSEINEQLVENEEGWREYTLPYSYVKDFPKDKAVKIKLKYKKRVSYYSAKENVKTQAHDVQKANIAFIIDRTGSMSSKIRAVKSNLANMVNTLKDRKIDVNFAVIDFNDKDITFHDINGAKWSSDHAEVIKVLESLKDDGYIELPMTAYEKLFTETPDWYKNADTNFIFLLTDEDADDYKSNGSIDTVSGTTKTMAEWASYLDDLGIYNTVVTTTNLNEFYKDLYDKTGGQVLDITSNDYGILMADFATHVEDRVTHTVKYDDFKVTAIGGTEGKVIVKNLKNGEKTVDVNGPEEGEIEFEVTAANAAQYFSEDPNNPGFTNFKIKNFGLDLTGITLEATEDTPETYGDNYGNNPNGGVYGHECLPPINFDREVIAYMDPANRPMVSSEGVLYREVVDNKVEVKPTAEENGVIKATGGIFDTETGSPVATAAGIVGAIAVLGAASLVVLNRRKHNR